MIVSQGNIYHHESLVKAIKQVDVVISALGSLSSHTMLVLHNIRIVPLNVRKNKETTECDKSTVTCDINTAQYKDGTIKCEKIIT